MTEPLTDAERAVLILEFRDPDVEHRVPYTTCQLEPLAERGLLERTGPSMYRLSSLGRHVAYELVALEQAAANLREAQRRAWEEGVRYAMQCTPPVKLSRNPYA